MLLDRAPPRMRRKLARGLNWILPVVVQHMLWRPSERAWVGSAMRTRDHRRARAEIEEGLRIAASLGVDVSEIEIPSG